MLSSLRGFLNTKVAFICFLVAFVILFNFSVNAQTPSASDDTATVNEDSSVAISVLDNDTDVDPDVADREISIIEGPEHGSVTTDDTVIQYTPDANYRGSDSLIYRITNTEPGGGSSEATVTIEVLPINDPPLPVKDLFTTQENTSVTFTLSATDEDIDPMRPDRHPIEFQLLGEPLHGEISGNIKDVEYDSPNKAFVELVYTPDPGFRGVETINYQVEDDRGRVNISSVAIDVLAETEAPTSLSGYWESAITITEDEPNFISDFSGNLTTIYRYSDVEWRTYSGWSEDSFDSVRLTGEIPMGLMEFNSAVSFDPVATDPFNYWRTRTDFEFSGIDFRHTFNLAQNPDSTYFRLEGRWSLAGTTFRSRTDFSGPEHAFDESRLRARWRCPDCEVTINTDIGFTSEGFDEFAVDVGDIPLFYWTYFEFETTFTADSKEVEPNLFFRNEWIDCLKILAELDTNDFENILEGFHVYGLRFRNTFPNGLTLRVDTAIDKDMNASVTGDSDYSQKYTLSGPFYAGYRAPGRLQLTTYLDGGGNNQLFGWGKSRLKMIAPLTDSFDVFSELVLQADDPNVELTLGTEVVW